MAWPQLASLVQRLVTGPAAFGVRIDWHQNGAGSVILTPAGAVLRGIYTAPHTEVGTEREVAVSIALPTLDVTAADLPAGSPSPDDEVTVLEGQNAGTRYVLTDRQEDGEGMFSLMLQEKVT